MSPDINAKSLANFWQTFRYQENRFQDDYDSFSEDDDIDKEEYWR